MDTFCRQVLCAAPVEGNRLAEPSEGLICVWEIPAIGALSPWCPVIPAHSQWTQD